MDPRLFMALGPPAATLHRRPVHRSPVPIGRFEVPLPAVRNRDLAGCVAAQTLERELDRYVEHGVVSDDLVALHPARHEPTGSVRLDHVLGWMISILVELHVLSPERGCLQALAR